MARRTDRNFIADFATLEIEYLPEKGPDVSKDIQMVYVMGNVAPAGAQFNRFLGVAPPNMPAYALSRAGVAAVGEASVGQLVARGESPERIHQSLARCELLCANCQAVREYERVHRTGRFAQERPPVPRMLFPPVRRLD